MSFDRSIRVIFSIFCAGVLVLCPDEAFAQMRMSGSGRSLGGYGAASISSYYGTGGGGLMPYSGAAAGMVPYRGGPSAGLGSQPISRQASTTPIGGAMFSGTPIGGASASGGMLSRSRGEMLMSDRTRSRTGAGLGPEGGIGMGRMGTMPVMSRTPARPSGLGFGYPFRVPPSFGGASSMP